MKYSEYTRQRNRVVHKGKAQLAKLLYEIFRVHTTFHVLTEWRTKKLNYKHVLTEWRTKNVSTSNIEGAITCVMRH